MMEAVFLKLINMSVSAGWLIIAVMLLRPVLKKAPKYIRCILWAIVGFRLICPFTLKSALSLIPSGQIISRDTLFSPTPTLDTGIASLDRVINPVFTYSFSPNPVASANPLQIAIYLASILWVAGIAAMLIYSIISYLVLKKRVSAAICLRDNLFICDDIDSPFIFGLLRPRIYIPSGIGEEQLASIEAHEKAHLVRLDHWWKLLGYVILAVHWFNPLVWAAYILLCRDIELACDERVVSGMDMSGKKAYSKALLECSVQRRSVAACPLAFGELGVKERVRTVLKYKKPAKWLIAAAIIICLLVCVFFLTDPVSAAVDSELDAFISQTILDHEQGSYLRGDFACEAHEILGVQRKGSYITVYAAVMYQEFSCAGGVISRESGSHIPTAITVRKTADGYTLEEYWISSHGTHYVPSIREKFPWYIENQAINIHQFASAHEAECIRQAEDYFGVAYIDPYADTTWTTTAVVAD